MENPIYNQIGINYSKYRNADPRLVGAILKCLDLSKQAIIGEIGAGTGNYSRAIAEQGYHMKCIELPHDLQDYFAAAGWRRPEIYLDPIVRSCMSGFAVANQTQIEEGVKELRQDLESGVWENNYGFLKQKKRMDVGYRFLVAN